MSFLKTTTPSAGGKGILFGNSFLPLESLSGDHPITASQKCLFYNSQAFPLYDYPEGFAPQVGDKCLICGDLCIPVYDTIPGSTPEIPTAGLVLHVPFEASAANAATGQALGYDGTVTYETYKGVPCANLQAAYVTFATTDIVSGGADRTLSIWFCTQSHQRKQLFVTGENDGTDGISIDLQSDGTIGAGANMISSRITSSPVTCALDTWHHVLLTYSAGAWKLYLNGALVAEHTLVLNTNLRDISMGFGRQHWWQQLQWLTARIAGARLYNRVVTADEIVALGAEFTPEVPQLPQGLVLYVPFEASAASAVTGQALEYVGTVTYETYKGVPCAYLQSAYVTFSNDNILFPTGDRTLSIWFCTQDYQRKKLFSLGENGGNDGISIDLQSDGTIGAGANMISSCITSSPVTCALDAWHHVFLTYSAGAWKLYLNGALVAEYTLALNLNLRNGPMGFGRFAWSSPLECLTARIAGARMYNHVVTADEAAALAAEFTPTGV